MMMWAERMPPYAVPWGIALVGSLAVAATGDAQRPPGVDVPLRAGAGACPSTGISIGVEDGGLAGPISTTVPGARAVARMDTSIAFSVTERTWRWRSVVAHVSAGVTGTDGAPWYVCAGAIAALREAVLTLRGVTGAIRFRADPSVLQSFRMRSDSVTPGQP